MRIALRLLLLTVIVTALPLTGLAIAIGTPVADVLETDIIATVDGLEIPSFNVNANTIIIAEDLQKYGFTVVWDGIARTLVVYAPAPARKMTGIPVVQKQQVALGKKVATVYHTDIKVYLQGHEFDSPTEARNLVTSYNLGGQTAILFDDLARWGRVNWNADSRAISVYIPAAWAAHSLTEEDFNTRRLGEPYTGIHWLLGKPVVFSIVPGSPAARAGLMENARVTHINGVQVLTLEEVNAEIRKYAPYETVRVTLLYGQQYRTVRLTLGVRPR